MRKKLLVASTLMISAGATMIFGFTNMARPVNQTSCEIRVDYANGKSGTFINDEWPFSQTACTALKQMKVRPDIFNGDETNLKNDLYSDPNKSFTDVDVNGVATVASVMEYFSAPSDANAGLKYHTLWHSSLTVTGTCYVNANAYVTGRGDQLVTGIPVVATMDDCAANSTDPLMRIQDGARDYLSRCQGLTLDSQQPINITSFDSSQKVKMPVACNDALASNVKVGPAPTPLGPLPVVAGGTYDTCFIQCTYVKYDVEPAVLSIGVLGDLFRYNRAKTWDRIPMMNRVLDIAVLPDGGTAIVLDDTGKIFQLALTRSSTTPTQISDGRLYVKMTSNADSTYALDRDGLLYQYKQNGQWVLIKSPQPSSTTTGVLSQIKTGFGGSLFALDTIGAVLSYQSYNNTWQQYIGQLSQIEPQQGGPLLWGVNQSGQLFEYEADATPSGMYKYVPTPAALTNLVMGEQDSVNGISSGVVYSAPRPINYSFSNFPAMPFTSYGGPPAIAQFSALAGNQYYEVDTSGQGYKSSGGVFNRLSTTRLKKIAVQHLD